MGAPNDISLSVLLAADYGSEGKGVAMWNYDGCLDVLVPSLWGNPSLRAGNVLSVWWLFRYGCGSGLSMSPTSSSCP